MAGKPYNETTHNVGNSILPGFNDKQGIALCGYEWGYSKHDQYLDDNHSHEIEIKPAEIRSFYQKAQVCSSSYDLRIIRWFEFFGHPLGGNNGLSALDKSILQTNWCDSQAPSVSDYNQFLAPGNLQNFLKTMDAYRPKILMLMGARQIQYLQNPVVKAPFSEIFGREIAPVEIQAKPFSGRKFRVAFQKFEDVNIISFPHPSGSRGLADDYIKLFSEKMKSILDKYRHNKGV